MPTYSYTCSHCSKGFDKFLKMDDRREPESQRCPNCSEMGKVQMRIGAPKIVSDVGASGPLGKTDSGWKEVLSKVKETHTINNIKS
jgi:putative FmdB family regulatory protein